MPIERSRARAVGLLVSASWRRWVDDWRSFVVVDELHVDPTMSQPPECLDGLLGDEVVFKVHFLGAQLGYAMREHAARLVRAHARHLVIAAHLGLKALGKHRLLFDSRRHRDSEG